MKVLEIGWFDKYFVAQIYFVVICGVHENKIYKSN